jgi:hypothetical protein
MKRVQAIQLLGGTPLDAALSLGVSVQAVNKWPEVLPSRISDRVLGAYMRKAMPVVVSSLLLESARVAHAQPRPFQGIANSFEPETQGASHA